MCYRNKPNKSSNVFSIINECQYFNRLM